MRTTLSIDNDVLVAVKERAAREKRSAGQVLSALAREALTREARTESPEHHQHHHGFQPLPHRGAAVSNALIDRLREDEPE
ncbi:MAG: CopG family transcriptional regulator [Mycobacteriales bacterium]